MSLENTKQFKAEFKRNNNKQKMSTDVQLFLAIYMLLLIATTPWLSQSFAPTGDTLDTSWVWALGYALSHHMQWGQNFLWTYGPLGFLIQPYFYANHVLWGLSAIVTLSTHIAFGLLYIYYAYLIIKTSNTVKKEEVSQLLIISGLTWLIAATLIDISTQAAFIAILILVYSLGEEQNKQRLIASLIGSGFLFGFASLIKSTGLIIAVFILLIYPLINWYVCRTLKSLVLGIIPFIVSIIVFIILFIGAGQNLGNIPNFIYGTVQIAKGYTPAMSTTPKGIKNAITLLPALIIMFTCFISGVVYLLKNNKLVTAQYIILGVILFWAWKEGFVRQDLGHVPIFCGVSLAVIAIMLNISFTNGENKQYNILAIVYLITFFSTILVGINLSNVSQGSNYYNFYKLFTSHSERNIKQEIEDKALIAQFPINQNIVATIGNGTVNIVPWDLMMTQAYHWSLIPSPVIQAYSVYTPYLDYLNATQIWNNHSAQNILYTFESIDGRYPLFDEPATFRAILYNYSLKKAGNNYSLLVKNTKINKQPKLQSIIKATTYFNKWITVPKEADYANIFIKTTPVGHLANIFYKPSQIQIYFRLDDGSSQGPFRFIYSTASDGVFIRYFVANQAEFNSLMSHNITGLQSINGIKIVSKGAGIEYDKIISINFLKALPPVQFFNISIKVLPVLHKQTLFSIDYINGILVSSQNNPILLNTNNKFINIQGWAVDKTAKESAGGVYIDVDGKIYPALYGIDRQDVSDYFKNPNYRYSGFQASIPLSKIGIGTHSLSIKILTKNQKAYYSPTQKVIFIVQQPTLYQHLTKLPSQTQYSIDYFDNYKPPLNSSKIITINSNEISLQGWAVDSVDNKTASFVFADINGKLYPLNYGAPRPDVAQVLKNPNYEYSGFFGTITADNLKKGLNTLKLRIINTHGTGYYESKPLEFYYR